MAIQKKYSGYKSFDYLSPSEFKKYELANSFNWSKEFKPYKLPLTQEQEKRLAVVLDKAVVISLHDHPISLPKNLHELLPYIKDGRVATDYEALSRSCLDAVIDNGSFLYLAGYSKHGWKWDEIIQDTGIKLCDIAHQDFAIHCKNVKDIIQAHNEGKIAFILGYESCQMIENELDRLDVLYGLGVRVLGLTYSEANSLGSGLREKRDAGLTAFGLSVVERLNKLGIAIDLAHVGDQSSLDAIEASSMPVFISHAGARTVWNTNRMKPDEVLVACAQKGGVIGIEAAPKTTMSREHPEQGLESMMDHFKYCVNLVGIDHVGFGPDCLYGDHVGLHNEFSELLSIKSVMQVQDTDQFSEVKYVKGAENPTEATNNIARWLIKNDYSDEDIIKVLGGNCLRVLNTAWV